MDNKYCNLQNENICALERSLELLRMIADTIDYVIKDPNPDQKLVETNLQVFYRVRGIIPLENHLTALDKLAVTADLASIEAYHRISGIEFLDTAVPKKSHDRLMRSLVRCVRHLYGIENPTNYVKISRDHLGRRMEIARSFKTYQFH